MKKLTYFSIRFKIATFYFICLLILGLSFDSHSQITYDGNGETTLSPPITSFTVPSGTDRLLVVTLCNGNDPNVTVTYNGMNLTPAIPGADLDVVYFIPLGSGGSITSDITVSPIPQGGMMAGSFQGIDQAAPLGNAINGSSGGSGTLSSIAGNLIVSKLGGQGTLPPVPSGWTNIGFYPDNFGLYGTANFKESTGSCSEINYDCEFCAQSLVEFIAAGSTGASGGSCTPPSMCDVAISGATPTPETCAMGNDGTLTVEATSSNPPINYAISGPANESNATGNFTGLPPGTYNITVTDATPGGMCSATSSAMVDAGMSTCPEIGRTNPNDPTSFDPCSCGDPLNYYDGNGDITYFHDFVEVTSVTGEVWEVSAVSAMAYSDNGMTNIMIGDVLTETAPGSGIYRIDLFHPPGVGFTMTVDRTAGGPPFPLMEGGTCTACKQVPTIGQWGLIILSLLILTFGVVALRSRQMVLAGAGTSSFPARFQQLPFDKKSFGKMLAHAMLGLAAVFTVSVAFFGYEMTSADVPGSLIAGLLLAYLMHLLNRKSIND